MDRVNTQLKLLIISGFLILASGVLFYLGFNNQPTQAPKPTQVLGVKNDQSFLQGLPKAQVVRVIDGDTIEISLDNQTYKLRYIGMDTPETVDPRRPVGCFGKQASDENKRLLAGQDIYLEKDVSERDKFGRLLRYVYLPLSDGTILFINDYLVRQGFAHAATFPPDIKYQQRFLEAEKEARQNQRGLWAACL